MPKQRKLDNRSRVISSLEEGLKVCSTIIKIYIDCVLLKIDWSLLSKYNKFKHYAYSMFFTNGGDRAGSIKAGIRDYWQRSFGVGDSDRVNTVILEASEIISTELRREPSVRIDFLKKKVAMTLPYQCKMKIYALVQNQEHLPFLPSEQAITPDYTFTSAIDLSILNSACSGATIGELKNLITLISDEKEINR